MEKSFKIFFSKVLCNINSHYSNLSFYKNKNICLITKKNSHKRKIQIFVTILQTKMNNFKNQNSMLLSVLSVRK
jgi:hypothetical protein